MFYFAVTEEATLRSLGRRRLEVKRLTSYYSHRLPLHHGLEPIARLAEPICIDCGSGDLIGGVDLRL